MAIIRKGELPKLSIELGPGKKLGHCYYEHSYVITTTSRLPAKSIKALAELNLLGYGQEFIIKSQCDGKEAQAGTFEVQRIDEDTGSPPLDWRRQPERPMTFPYFKYEIIRRVDSSD